MTTNDPRAGYGAEQRGAATIEEPDGKTLLELVIRVLDENPIIEDAYQSMRDLRAKITSGELRVSKMVKRSDLKNAGPVSAGGDYMECQCGGLIYETGDNFCPGCGARIIE